MSVKSPNDLKLTCLYRLFSGGAIISDVIIFVKRPQNHHRSRNDDTHFSRLFSPATLSLSLQYCVVGPSRLPVYVNYDKEEDGNGTTSNSFASSPYYYFLESLGFSLSALPDRKVQAFLPALTAPLLRRFFVTNLSTPFECSVGGRSPSQPPHPAVPLRFAFTF